MKAYRFILTAFILINLSLLPTLAQTSPEKFFGHRMGEDRKLVDAGQIVQYLKLLSSETPKLKLLEIGQSTQKRPLVMAVITAEANMAKLEQYVGIARKLRDPRLTSEEEARRLAKEGKAILLITCNLHSTEIASAQMALELAYKLVSSQTPFNADQVLRDVIFLLIPTTNPDGTQMVCDWYRKYVGTPFEGGRMPWLYHVYAGHDDNRDWYMFNLPETRAVTQVLYRDWLPQIHLDEHQQGSTGSRLFIPPFMDPPVPQIQALLWRSVALCGANMAYDLEKKGYSGVAHRRSYTGWWIGACDDTSWLHNVVGLLSEAASVKVASPIYVEPIEVEKSYTQKRIDFPNPWKGGWWRLRDIVDYELELSFSLIKTAALYREDFLFNSYRMYKASLETRAEGEPFAYIIPAEQHDPLTARRLIGIAMTGGVEVHQASEDFTVASKKYAAGSWVILTSQPYKPYTVALFERQKYPDLRQREGEPPIPPYDNAGWTLPLQMGVSYERICQSFSTQLTKLEVPPEPPQVSIPAGASHFVLDPRLNLTYKAVFALLREKIEVTRCTEPLTADGVLLPAGAFVIRTTPAAEKVLADVQKKIPIPVLAAKEIPGDARFLKLASPRIAMYQSWTAGMDEGWTRYVLDDFAIPYTIVHNADFKPKVKGQKITPLASRFDAIILPSESYEMIKSGKPDPNSRWGAFFTPMPPEYEGGIEKEGVDALKEFVGQGGRLLTFTEANDIVLKEFKPPLRNDLERLDDAKFFCPTSILRLQVDITQPLGWGLDSESAAMFADGMAFSTRVPSGEWDRRVVASFPEEGSLLSGWLTGENYLSRKAAIVDLKYKKGRIFLYGVPVQNRAQTHGTYKLLFNALLYPEEK